MDIRGNQWCHCMCHCHLLSYYTPEAQRLTRLTRRTNPFTKWPFFFFFMETTNKLLCASVFFMVVWRNAFTGRWKLPRSSFNRSYNLSLFNQLQNGCQPAWIICTAKKHFSEKPASASAKFSLILFFFGKYACRCIFCFDGKSLKFQMSCKLWVYFNYSWKRPPLRS